MEFAFVVSLFIVLISANASQSCTSWSLQGKCVPYKECPFTKNSAEFLNPATFLKIQDRLTACSDQGKNLVCCEDQAVIKKPASIVTTTELPQVPSESPLKVATRLSEEAAVKFDVTTHPNYVKFFTKLRCGSVGTIRVSNGENAELFEFPWAARLGYRKDLGGIEYKCSGTLVTKFHVITAAHCLNVRSSFKLDHVRLGEYDSRFEMDCDRSDPEDIFCSPPVQDVKFEKFAAHPAYSLTTFINDIGIIKLSEVALVKQQNIRTICLPLSKDLIEIPKQLVISGWGRTQNASSSPILQKAYVPLYNKDDCLRKFKYSKRVRADFTLTDGQFCAGGQDKVDTCKGDSGSSIQGAALVDDKPKLVVFGIVSFGDVMCGGAEGFPGVYTAVSAYLPWLFDNM